MTRRELLQTAMAAPLASAATAAKLDRKAIVRRHNPVVTKFDFGSSLSVGNGAFAFTVDGTGLQTIPEPYLDGVPLTTQAEWAWHSMGNPAGYRYEDTFEEYTTHNGRKVRYPSKWDNQAGRWLRQTPYRLGLVEIGFVGPDGALRSEDIRGIRQELDLWDGNIRSGFEWKGARVDVVTAAHPERDAVAVRVSSDALTGGGLRVQFVFPFTSSIYPWKSSPFSRDHNELADAVARGEKWTLEIISRKPGLLVVKHNADSDHYVAAIRFPQGATIGRANDDRLILTASASVLEFTVEFTPEPQPDALPDFTQTVAASTRHWNVFWHTGAALDLSGSTDPRAVELERRAVLSQYLTAIQCSGKIPPQETGLGGNSWYGKFHGEMHWWHAAHFPMWGRPVLLERSMPWYREILPLAQAYAAAQGYRGARWPKECGPEARVNPSIIGPFLIWQQPHLIYFAEQFYRERPDHKTVAQYAEIVDQTAEFMASFAEFDARQGRYFLGPPVIPVQETHAPQETWNPTFELSYWAWGLKTAQRWRERAGLPRKSEWDHAIKHVSPLPVHDGVYVGAESEPNLWEKNRKDHPSFLGALGVLPGDLADRETMRRTLHLTLEKWDWQQTWGWDYPMAAMTAARLGDPETAIRCLLMDVQKNRYTANGHCFQSRWLAGYLPGNGGLLAALAMMAAGWDGGPADAPGFPKDGKWQVKSEGLRRSI